MFLLISVHSKWRNNRNSATSHTKLNFRWQIEFLSSRCLEKCMCNMDGVNSKMAPLQFTDGKKNRCLDIIQL